MYNSSKMLEQMFVVFVYISQNPKSFWF